MRKSIVCVAVGLGIMSAPAQAYTDQKPGLLIYCASFIWNDGVQRAYVTPVYKISNKSYDRYWNWEAAAKYEQSFGRPMNPGTYGMDSTQGQYSKLLEEKGSLGRGSCFAATSMESVKAWRSTLKATIDTSEWRDWKPSGYSAQVLEVMEFPHN